MSECTRGMASMMEHAVARSREDPDPAERERWLREYDKLTQPGSFVAALARTYSPM